MYVLNMKGKKLAKWIALQENQQRCLTEYFTARPKTEADRQRKRRHDNRVTLARLTRQPTARRTQLVLAGTAGAAADGMEAQLAFSRHIPAHALAGGRLQQVEPASAKRQDPCASAHQRNLAPRCLAQTHIKLTGTGLALDKTRHSQVLRKRRRTTQAGAQRSAEKRLRTLTHAADGSCTGKRRRPDKVVHHPHVPPGGEKRKHGNQQGRQSATGKAKRKSATGFTQMLSATQARCDSSSTHGDAHSEGGSMRIGSATAVEILSTTVMRPVD